MLPRPEDLLRVLPEMIWCGFAVFIMFLQPFIKNKHFFTFLALAGSLIGGGCAFISAAYSGTGFYGLIQADAFSSFFRVLIGAVAFLVVLAAGPYLNREKLPFADSSRHARTHTPHL